MRAILIIAIFGMLLLPGLCFAETYADCLPRCSAELSSSNENCPPPTDEARTHCILENQAALKRCIDGCAAAATAEAPKESPAEAPSDAPAVAPPVAPPDAPADTPKEN